ncbi:MAG: single-stranded-DNA-specific exonuclease RecJ [Pseudomonadota bacterium]
MLRTLVPRSPSDTDGLSGYHPVLQRVYAGRGVQTASDLDLSLSSLLLPATLAGVRSAAERLYQALQSDERILIVGDFDADGATSTALAMEALRAFGATDVRYLIPNRFEYGYGLTPEIVALATEQAPALIITVDNGISSIEGVDAANASGIDVLVTDHHLPGATLPKAAVIVNPNLPECGFPSGALAGVGVIFYVMSFLRAHLREIGWFTERGLTEPNMAQFLDLVALGTVADVVPLDHNNRVLVSAGLQRIQAGKARPGIQSLLAVAGRNVNTIVASDLGFAAGPRLNAAGRLDDMSLGIECLLARDEFTARNLALQLDAMNRERQQIERGMERDALAALERITPGETESLPSALVMHDDHWHQGVVGILASRLKDRYQRPVIAFADVGDGQLKGSGRGISGLHMRDLLDRVATLNPGLISHFGGHAMAAGLSLPAKHFDAFSEAFTALVGEEAGSALTPTLETDGEIDAQHLSLDVAELLRQGGPWGQRFPEPLFQGEFELVEQRIVGERHLKCRLKTTGDDGTAIDAIAFSVDLEQWPDERARNVRLAYRLDVNEYRGRRSLQLMIEQMEKL